MTDVITNVFNVFDAVGEWFVDAVNNMIPLFYTAPTADSAGGLTFIGVTALISLGISVIMLIVATIRSYLTFSA